MIHATARLGGKLLIILFVLAMLMPQGAWAANFCVGTASELQAALNTAAGNSADDAIKIRQGTYTGNFTFASYQPNDLIIAGGYGTGCASREPDASNTTLDANDSGRPLYIANPYDVNIAIDAVTLTNGYVGGEVGVNSVGSSNGGGLLLEAPLAQVSISRSAITGNYADYDGGGAYLGVEDGYVTITQTEVTGNTAYYGHGGGLYVDAGSATYTANDISGNSAGDGYGGGVYMPMTILQSAVFDDNTIDDNSANYGGGLAVYGGSVLAWSANTDPEIADTLALTGNTITDNYSDNAGGGVWFSVYDGVFTASGNTISSNTADDGSGGGVYINDNYTASLSDNTIDDNWAYDAGGGVYIDTYLWGNQTLTGNTITNNTADDSSGGGVHVSADSSEDVTLSGNTISDNSAWNGGGGVHVYDADDVVLSDNTISDNTASYGSGGGASVEYSNTAAITGNTITGNNTYNNGGAGLAVYSVGSSTIEDNTITGNSFNYTVIAVAVNAENGTTCGGGVMVYGENETMLTGNDISDNSAYYANGGGACVYVVEATLTNNNFDNNTSNHSGGAAWVHATGYETSVLVNNVASDNSAGNSGGGFYVDASYGSTYLTNNTLTRNEANDGGGLYVRLYDDEDYAAIYNNILWANEASDTANDLYIGNDGNDNETPSTADLFNNDFDHAAGIADSGFYASLAFTPDASNLDKVDPVFIDPANDDFHLLGAYSPVVDAGSNDAPEILATDKDGNDRVMFGTTDIGAYEWQGAPPAPDVKANGSDGPVIVSSSATVTVTAALEAGTHEGESADWYIMATAPSGKYWLTTSGWQKSETPLKLQTEDLSDVSATSIFSGKLPKGTYSVVFIINLDGTLYSDTVNISVQ